MAYRGRVLVELDTRFGNHADPSAQPIMAQELIRVMVSIIHAPVDSL